MTTENIEKKVVETVAENKETIQKVLTKGVDHKFGVIFASALVTTGLAVAVSAVGKKLKSKKSPEKEEHANVEDIQEVLDKAAEVLRETDDEVGKNEK